jgi:molybdopterin molybdotransferase
MKNIGTVVLAGGNSSRLGRAKQTLSYKGSTLLEKTLEQVKKADLGPVLVVVGAYAAELSPLLKGEEVLLNPQWETGMGSSIAAGVRAMEARGVEAIVLCVSDQPFLHAPLLRRLAAEFPRYQKVCSAYGGSVGVPCLFGKIHFDALKNVSPERGAKGLLLGEDTKRISFPAGQWDIDTQEDFQELRQEMLDPEEALALLFQRIPFTGKETLSLGEAQGRVLAEDVHSDLDLPPFHQSSMDGYAIRFMDRSADLRVVGELRAGAAHPLSIGEGEAVRVFTGAPLPEGGDTVIMQEKVEKVGDAIRCKETEMVEGMHVRSVGAEIKIGDLAMARGTVLSSAALGYLGSLGRSRVAVRTVPKVSLVLTGDELVPAGEKLDFGQVYESNSLALLSAFKAQGVEAVEVKFAKDDRAALKATLEEALNTADLVVCVGGVSVGEYDLVVPVAEELGVKPCFHKVKQKPGKPLFFGTKGERWFLGLPGNPSSALVCFYVYVVPVLQAWLGKEALSARLRAKVMAPYEKKAGLTHFLKAWHSEGEVWPLGAQESYRLHTFKEANALMVLPEEGVKIGDTVEIIILP